ncbi:MAG: ATP-binding cassette domain-containing protein [Alphaproteobacteria bacterium]|jgi:ABC-2 type transport system ATP-binding protein|nr:ATP-binding cassette domain-containing protein [Alphaproteobacteria bacterium]MDP6876024.1 ATP-binding cassette domain-containing protein [Alphaproteobacteria bacterium]
MIEVEDLTKSYGSHLGIEGLTFSAKKGETIGFLGPNGAGKTTTMRILTCYFPATSGKATVAGFDCFEDSFEVRKRIGYLPENVPLYGDMIVDDYLAFVAGIKGVDGRAVKQTVVRTMGDCGLDAVAGRPIGELSKGYRQRVGLAQALVNDPEILILDEPTNGLDPRQIKEIRKLIGDLAERRTIVLCSHILPEVSMVCERVIIINKGKLVAVDTPENLIANLRDASRLFLRIGGEGDRIAEALRAIQGIGKVEPAPGGGDGDNGFVVELKKGADGEQSILPVIVANNWKLNEMRTMETSLEDVFIQLVTEEDGP